MKKIGFALILILMFTDRADADQRIVCAASGSGRVIAILGASDPSPANTITLKTGSEIVGLNIDKYECSGTTVVLRPSAQLITERIDEWSNDQQNRIDAITNIADAKLEMKRLVKAIERVAIKALGGQRFDQ